jgi:methylated-DNA-[protein]-cysteine S-methyltransferase
MTIFYDLQESPVGLLLLTATKEALRSIWMGATPALIDPAWSHGTALLEDTKAQLAEYFVRKRERFSIQMEPIGTEFQRRVWVELEKISYGATIHYGELARRIGDPNASRAVGLANGKNPISILIPCHRVIGKSGSLTGYAGGLSRKRFLLELEQRLLPLGKPL